MAGRVLEGIRIPDLTRVVAGPLLTAMRESFRPGFPEPHGLGTRQTGAPPHSPANRPSETPCEDSTRSQRRLPREPF